MKTHTISIYFIIFCFEMLIGKHLLNMHVRVCVCVWGGGLEAICITSESYLVC